MTFQTHNKNKITYIYEVLYQVSLQKGKKS